MTTGQQLEVIGGHQLGDAEPQRRSGRIQETLKVGGRSVGTLLVVSLVTFLATNVAPGTPARAAFGIFVSQQRIQEFRQQEGLNQPVLERYFGWLGRLATGHWGTSLVNGTSVSQAVFPAFERTLIVGAVGTLTALVVASAAGVLAARRAGGLTDVCLSVPAMVLNSIPAFVIGFALILILPVGLHVLPVNSEAVLYGSTGAKIDGYVMPCLATALVVFPYFFWLTRAKLREVAQADFVVASYLRGVPTRRLTRVDILPNAMLPLASAFLLVLADVMAGLVLIETVFSFPGAGYLLEQAVSGGDATVVQAIALLFATTFVVANLAADLLMLAVDPRLRRE